MNYIGLIFTKLTPNITTDKDIEKSKYIIYATIHPCMKAAHRTVVFIVYSYKWWCHYRNHFCQYDLALIQLFPQFKIMWMHELKIWPSIGERCL